MLKRFEEFKRYKTKMKYQDKIIYERKKAFVNACDSTTTNDEVKETLLMELKESEQTKNDMILKMVQERHELESIIDKADMNDNTRTVISLYFLYFMSLGEIADEMCLSYEYVRQLNKKGKQTLCQVVS